MKRAEYWKNFSLGKELDIAGRFIYNGLQCFHHMKKFYYEEEVFEFFYNLSVGFERLLKITIILSEHDDDVDQKEFEKSLITHSHLALLKRVKDTHNLSFGPIHNELLQVLERFYKTHRYGRYDLAAMTVDGREKQALHSFLEKYLQLEIDDEIFLGITQNDDRAKRIIGKCIGKIAGDLFALIRKEAHRLNIYTYEIRYGSKASKVFHFAENTFNNEDILWKELLVFFMNTKEKNGILNFIREITPLEFDPALAGDYLMCFRDNIEKLAILDELEHLYEELDDVKHRLKLMSVIGETGIGFDEDMDQ